MTDGQIDNAILFQNTRPGRPNVPPGELTDGLWGLIQQAWLRHPNIRPSMDVFKHTMEEVTQKVEKPFLVHGTYEGIVSLAADGYTV